MRELSPGYSSEVDTIDERAWCQILEQFDDANIYQTWSYDEVRCGRDQISHLLLKKNGDVVAVAQARIVTLPLVKAGIAYVRWGPLWCRHDDKPNSETFCQAIRALRNEYACKRGLVLRLYPVVFDNEQSCFLPILKQEGFSIFSKEKPSRTLILDLRLPLEELRKGLRPHWRRYLKVAENSGLDIVESTDDSALEAFIIIYKEMVARKKFPEPNDIYEFRLIQERLPDKFKLKILLCRSGGEVCAGLICSVIGNTAVYLFGATSDYGLKLRGAYLLHWKLIEWLKENGVEFYDLNGINPVINPGTYKFKADLCGNNGKDVHFLGRFDSCTNVLSHSCVASGDSLRMIYRTVKNIVTGRNGRVPAMNDETNGPSVRSAGLPATSDTRSSCEPTQAIQSPRYTSWRPPTGFLILNADDWGRDLLTTNRILECSTRGAVSSVSAMVFMEDSERAGELARQRGIEAGLHLNFTTPFSSASCSAGLHGHQQKVARYLLRHRLAQVVFHPGLIQSFEYLVVAQIDEYRRIYGTDPERLDGHHHMHLCTNVLFQRLLPPGTIVRRNFSFERGEKSLWNRLYRRVVDRGLARQHRLVDFFFSLPPLDPPGRLQRIYSLAHQFVVELETHPVNPEEYKYLTGEGFPQMSANVRIMAASAISKRGTSIEKWRLPHEE
jgi:chitin disaccharide deacetylase